MKVNGYKLQDAAKYQRTLVDVYSKQFDQNINQFEKDESKRDLGEVYQDYKKAELRLALVNHLQASYNQTVKVTVLGRDMKLDEAIKLCGPAARLEKKWRKALGGGEEPARRRSFFGSGAATQRDPSMEYASPAKTIEFLQEQVRETARFASAVRAAVKIGNSAEVEFEGLEPGLLDV